MGLPYWGELEDQGYRRHHSQAAHLQFRYTVRIVVLILYSQGFHGEQRWQ